MEDERLVRGVDRCQQLKVEPDLAEILMTELLSMGFNRVLLLLAPSEPEQQWEELEHHRELLCAAQKAGL
jgi:hypothetical protein